MKIKIELFGVCREFSEQDYLDFNFESDIKIKDLRKEVEGFVNKKFPENKNYLEMVKKSAFSSQANEIVDDDFKLDKNQTISIIPPIGGG
tara:strand:- start:583 stop:852 length:270 start_codon:yes stop_codon:yes gene_type:complete